MAKSKTPKAAERRSKTPAKIDAIMAEIAKLDEDDREELLDRIEEEYPEPTEIPAWQIEILKKRIANAKKNPDDHIPWEEVKKKLQAKR